MSAFPDRLSSVLVVDDTIENLRILANMLGEQGYDVRPVTNGRQALLAVEHDPPDLILLDINMPEMDGYDVCRRLKASAHSKDVPVIFLTALTETADKMKAFEAGGVDYITKPFHFEEVLARVKAHVALQRARVELQDSYTRLRELETLRDDLVHMIVHDMRSPLTALEVSLELLSGDQDAARSPADADLLRMAIETARDLNRMASDLLDVSRLEAGMLPIERATCDLTGMADEVRAVIGRVEPERRIDVVAGGPIEVKCDGPIIRRVMENLVGNAIKHTPPGTRIQIDITRPDGRARVAVHDEGPGVPVEARTKIFEKFGTMKTRMKHSYHSAGLGLAFCKLAVEGHDGTIGVEARVPVGSTFWFELPAEPGRP